MTSTIPTIHDRLSVPVAQIMRPGVIAIAEDATLLQAKRAMVRHGVHAVLVVGSDGAPLGWVSDHGLLTWLTRDMSAIPAAHAITEPPRTIEPDASARDALEALDVPGVSHLVVIPASGAAPHGVIAAMDLVDLMTRPDPQLTR